MYRTRLYIHSISPIKNVQVLLTFCTDLVTYLYYFSIKSMTSLIYLCKMSMLMAMLKTDKHDKSLVAVQVGVGFMTYCHSNSYLFIICKNQDSLVIYSHFFWHTFYERK